MVPWDVLIMSWIYRISLKNSRYYFARIVRKIRLFLPVYYYYKYYKNNLTFIAHKSGFSQTITILDPKLRNSSYFFFFRKRTRAKKYFITVIVKYLDNLSNREKLLGSFSKKYLEDDNAIIIFDLCNESISDHRSERLFLNFHKILEKEGIDNNRVIFITSNISKDFYDKWLKKNNLDYRVNVIGYNHYTYIFTDNFVKSLWYIKNNKKWVDAIKKSLEENVIRNNHYITLNYKLRPQRSALVIYLFHNNYDRKGVITYIGDKESHEIDENSIREYSKALLLGNMDENKITECFKKLESLKPITYKCSAHEFRKSIWTNPTAPSFIIPDLIYHPGEFKVDSYVEIVTETYLSDSSNLYITEKTVRPILRLQPFIHIGAPYVLRELKNMGFKTFSPYINESYDDIEDPVKRFSLILDQVDHICNMSLEDLHKMSLELFPILEHNFYHLCNNYRSIINKELEERLLPALASKL